MTEAEKNSIRNSPCIGCGNEPPFEDRKRCHVHRILPGSAGGKYTPDNVEPRCSACHDQAHGGDGQEPFIGAATRGGRKGGRSKSRAKRRTAQENMYKARAAITPDIRSRNSKNGSRSESRMRAARTNILKAGASLTMEQRRAGGRKGGLKTGAQNITKWNEHPEARRQSAERLRKWNGKGRHVRWHLNRGVLNPSCSFCRA